MKICVVGTGYVGLVAGTCFAESGNDVVCVDNVAAKIEALRQGKVPIYEPGLEELIRRNTTEGRLTFTMDLADAVKRSLVCFIAVGTPSGHSGAADLSAVMAVSREIARAMDGYRVVVTKSTVPVGTWAQIHAVMSPVTSHQFDIVSNPEFLKEGAAIDDFMKPDRVVIGTISPKAIEVMRELYEPFVRTGNPIITMDNTSAEMTKYAANALLATRISFMNEIANLCERAGADVDQVRRGIGYDRRIGHHFLFPGVGYGGSCFPKDVRAVITTAREHGMEFPLMAAVEDVNEAQKHRLVLKAVDEFGPNLRGKHFAIWGLAFKPRTDDMREAPSITVVEGLLKRGGTVAVHDPEALHEARRLFGDRVSYHRVNYEALAGADALLIVTEWNEFRRPDFPRMRQLMRHPLILDGRNLYEPEVMREQGFTYLPIGRTPVRVPSASRRRMARILITGGAGFIGSHLCERFLDDGDDVVCMDNLLTGAADNVAHLFTNRRFTFIQQDVTTYIYVKGPVDAILHFASPASPIDYLELPIQTLKVGSLGTHKALGLAKEKGARFLLASTSEVYGDPLTHPQNEEYWGNVNPIGPRGVYDEAKRFAEAITMAYHRTHRVDTRIVRIFNTYGPRMRLNDGRVVPNFISQALKDEPLTVYGDGSQTRSFCYVSDLVEGITRLLRSDYSDPVNCGNPNETTILEFAERIKALTKSRSEIVFRPLPVDDPKVRQPDIARARKLLGWEPKVALEDGLGRTIDYFKPTLGLP